MVSTLYQRWLNKVYQDLKWTEANLKEKIWYGACFTAQQAEEKAREACGFSKEIVEFVEGKIAK